MREREHPSLGVLTYTEKHRKTYDTLCLLKAKGYRDVSIYASPYHYKKIFFPLIEHRPMIQMEMPSTEEICENFSYEYKVVSNAEQEIPKNRILLICGAGILSEKFVREHCVINAHPGYIPNCRGLDALKWAIYEEEPIGVTTHLLGELVDAGEIIERRMIPIFEYDTFHAVAQRVYETEISMLVEAIEKLEEEHLYIEPGTFVLHRRMPHELEKDLLKRFEARKLGKR